MSLSDEALQLAREAPKRVPTVRPPVDEALVKSKMLAVRDDTVVVAKVEVPNTESVEEKSPVVPEREPRDATVE
jgi:hypothetical protein